MIWIRFGKWDSHAGRVFLWERLYHHGYKWTPLCRVSFRYLKTMKECHALSDEKPIAIPIRTGCGPGRMSSTKPNISNGPK